MNVTCRVVYQVELFWMKKAKKYSKKFKTMHSPLNVILKTLTANACFCEQTKLIELKEYIPLFIVMEKNFQCLEEVNWASEQEQVACFNEITFQFGQTTIYFSFFNNWTYVSLLRYGTSGIIELVAQYFSFLLLISLIYRRWWLTDTNKFYSFMLNMYIMYVWAL